MKKNSSKPIATTDDVLPEYDFSGGVRGKYAKTLREEGYTIRVYHDDGTYSEEHVLGEKTVVLEPDVWEYFQDSGSVNRALRTLISIVPEKRKLASKKAPNADTKCSCRYRLKSIWRTKSNETTGHVPSVSRFVVIVCSGMNYSIHNERIDNEL